jgi:glycosyl transferase family 87
VELQQRRSEAGVVHAPAVVPRLALAAAAALAIALAGPAIHPSTARAADDVTIPTSQTKPPPSFSLNAKQAIAIANRTAAARKEFRVRQGLRPIAYTKAGRHWQVSYFQRGKERAQVQIDDRTKAVLEQWTGPQVAWRMARGYEGAFGRSFNAPYVWIPLGLLFLAPFIDPRRPFRLLHLDLLVLCGFAVSHVFFNRGEIYTSVPLAYPVLLYLLIRLLFAGFRPRARPGKLVPYASATVLMAGVIFLVGFRVALNVTDSNVIDVGYAGVIGADRIVDGSELYNGHFPVDNARGDTYGPVNYLAYVPFEQAFPWSGQWDDLPAAHAAALAFDLLTAAGLFLLGRQIRAGPKGRLLGAALAYAWLSYPYSLFALSSNANDSLVSMLLVFALLALASPPGRGALLALASAVKFVPVALAPLFAGGTGDRRLRSVALFTAAFAVLTVVVLVPLLPPGGLHAFWERTLGYQAGRDSPFSIWGLHPDLEPLRVALVIAGAGLALLVAFVPRRRSPAQVAALGAAVLIAAQLVTKHWFYLYIVWFAPYALIALFGEYSRDDESARDPAEAAGAEQDPEPVAA